MNNSRPGFRGGQQLIYTPSGEPCVFVRFVPRNGRTLAKVHGLPGSGVVLAEHLQLPPAEEPAIDTLAEAEIFAGRISIHLAEGNQAAVLAIIGEWFSVERPRVRGGEGSEA